MPREKTTSMREKTTDDAQSSTLDHRLQTQLQRTLRSDYPLTTVDDEPPKRTNSGN